MKIKVYFFTENYRHARIIFERFADYGSGKAGVIVSEYQLKITTPRMELYFRSKTARAELQGIHADISIPYDAEIMSRSQSQFGRKDCDEEKIFKVFCKDIEEAAAGKENAIDELFTASSEEEFKEGLKRGKPFQLKPEAQIMIASINEDKPPIVQIAGRDDIITKMMMFGISEIMNEQINHGIPPETIKELWHKIIDGAFQAEIEARKKQKGADA